jgi:hypothetical protein
VALKNSEELARIAKALRACQKALGPQGSKALRAKVPAALEQAARLLDGLAVDAAISEAVGERPPGVTSERIIEITTRRDG